LRHWSGAGRGAASVAMALLVYAIAIPYFRVADRSLPLAVWAHVTLLPAKPPLD
jgi:hypothetical protein